MKTAHRLCVSALCCALSACNLFDFSSTDDDPGGVVSSGPVPSGNEGFGPSFAGGPASTPAGFPISSSAQPLRLEEVRSSEAGARPISGGTLAVSGDGKLAVAADSDRDCVYVVATAQPTTTKLQLPVGSEPGRVVLDASGTAHVVLRGSGKLLRVDTASGAIAGDATLCAQPRGVAYDATRDELVCACMDGQVVTLDAKSYQERSRSFVAQDLRDVVVDKDGRVFVSRYRSAELIQLDSDGSEHDRSCPEPATGSITSFETTARGTVGHAAAFSATLAWRAVANASGDIWMLHQQSQVDEVATSPGGYGAGCTPITQSAVTRFGAAGPLSSMAVATQGLSVDVAVSPDGTRLAVASPGAYLQARPTLQMYATGSMGAVSQIGCTSAFTSAGESSQIVAVSYDASGLLYTFSREPAELEIYRADNVLSLERLVTVALDRRSVRDTGHELFHTDVGSGLSCASCHGEALDDGHVWNFQGIGERRTQNIRGGLLGTAPFHWDGDMTSFRRLVDEVMTGRMGGFFVNDEYASALGDWIDKQPALRLPAQDAAAADRGRALFQASETKCASCHAGDALTNNQSADVGTGAVLQVPSLRGLGPRAPYMHDGCAKTLEDRFTPACGGGDKHGKTSQLNAAQIADLCAYLRTL